MGRGRCFFNGGQDRAGRLKNDSQKIITEMARKVSGCRIIYPLAKDVKEVLKEAGNIYVDNKTKRALGSCYESAF